MKKPVLTAVLTIIALLVYASEASSRKPPAHPQKRVAQKRATRQQNALPVRLLPAKNAVQWNCAQNKVFWLSGDFKSDSVLTLHWSGRNYILPRVSTTTGARRFQDLVSGLDLVVLPFKAMLLNSGTRSRLVDECKTLEMAAADAHSESTPPLFEIKTDAAISDPSPSSGSAPPSRLAVIP